MELKLVNKPAEGPSETPKPGQPEGHSPVPQAGPAPRLMPECAFRFDGKRPCNRNAWRKDGKFCYAHSSLPKRPYRHKDFNNNHYWSIRTEILKWDEGLAEENDLNKRALDAAIVMLAALEIGQDVDKLHEYLGALVPKYKIRWYGQNLRQNGVWKDGVTYAAWADEETGIIAFFCDVNVALGLMVRR